MNFINPKTDYAFKKIFGSEESREILVSFLNAILYQGHSTIEDLEILSPYLVPRIRGVKDTYLDVKAQLKTGEIVIIEMQVLNVEGFEKRILYNAAKAYSIQLDIGEDYSRLNPVIALTITDFIMFPHLDQIISRFILKEKDYLVDYIIDDLELVFVELPKFTKTLEQLATLADQWLYFLKDAKHLKDIPQTMVGINALRKAFERANRANLTREELEDIERQEIFIQDQRNAIKKAIQQGIQQGKKETQIEIAKQLLDLLDEEVISQRTGLTLEEIKQLKEQSSRE